MYKIIREDRQFVSLCVVLFADLCIVHMFNCVGREVEKKFNIILMQFVEFRPTNVISKH